MPIDLNKGPASSGASDPWSNDLYAPPEDDQIIDRGFDGLDATRGKRLGGALLDGVFTLVSFLVGSVILTPFIHTTQRDPDQIVLGALLVYLGPLLFSILQMFLISTRGQSLGKMLVGTRIILMNGDQVGFLHGVVLRAWIFIVLGFIPLINLVTLIDPLLIFGEERRCLHDRVAGTRVIEAG